MHRSMSAAIIVNNVFLFSYDFHFTESKSNILSLSTSYILISFSFGFFNDDYSFVFKELSYFV